MTKSILRATIEAATNAFLANGGQIIRVARGASTYRPSFMRRAMHGQISYAELRASTDTVAA